MSPKQAITMLKDNRLLEDLKNRRTLNRHSIRTQMILLFVGIMTFVLVLCLLCNSIFLNKMYVHEKKADFRQAYSQLASYIDENGEVNEETKDSMKQAIDYMRYADSISMILVTMSWSPVLEVGNMVSANELSEMLIRLQENVVGSKEQSSRVTVLESKDNYILQEVNSLESGTSYMECYGKFGNNLYFLMRSALAPIEDSAKIANRFLLMTILAGIILSVLLIYVAMEGFTRPILKLADLSQRMAKLDFSSHYEGRQKNEVGILGRSMNQMQDQLRVTIEELQQANAQLTRDIEEKIQIDEVRKEFLSNVSHELKTPIALIQGYAEGLQMAINDDAESREFYCDVIIDEANKMSVMVQKLLTLNHLEFGQDALTRETFNLSELIDTVIRQNQVSMDKKGITVEKDFPASLPVKADEFKMEEVCTNYITNAINHANGSLVIRVRAEQQSASQIRVTVFNTGDPIPEDSLDKVWIKFYKVDKARTREYGGSGIGLSIVKAIMDAHGQPCGCYNTSDGVAFWFCCETANEEDENAPIAALPGSVDKKAAEEMGSEYEDRNS